MKTYKLKLFITITIIVIVIVMITVIAISSNSSSSSETDSGEDTPTKSSSRASDWLKEHNSKRKKFNRPDVSWSYELANQATEYASKLYASGTFQHGDLDNPVCSSGRCGQNLQKGPGSNAQTSVMDWYNECSLYTTPDFSHEAGHYSQVMWKDTKNIGCGTVGDVSVCLYDTGNVIGQFGDNAPVVGC